jgi:hypothetical protein
MQDAPVTAHSCFLSSVASSKETSCKQQPSSFKHFTTSVTVTGGARICLSLFTNKPACVSPAPTNHVSGPINGCGTNLLVLSVGRLNTTAVSGLSLPMSARFSFAFTAWQLLLHISKFWRKTLHSLHFLRNFRRNACRLYYR